MKKIQSILLATFLVVGFSSFGQLSEKEINKEIQGKAVKEARKEAKQLEKEGWRVAQGGLPMDKVLEKAWYRQFEEDENGYPKYIVGTGNSVAESQAAAKLQATELAKLEMAGAISTQVAALIESNVANQQLSADEAASVTKTVAAAKNIIAQELGRTLTLIEIYRNTGNGGKNIEASVRLAYSSDMATEAAKKVIRKSLEEETNIAHEKLEKLMGMNN